MACFFGERHSSSAACCFFSYCLSNWRCLHLSLLTLLRHRPRLRDYTCPFTNVQAAAHPRPRRPRVHYLLVSISFPRISHFIYLYNAAIEPPSYVYSPATLLSLRPFADESMKGKMLVTCPEVVMTRKIRKGLEFYGGRTELSAAQQLLVQEPTRPASDAHNLIHENRTPTVKTSTTPGRRRSRPATRAPERRRNPFAAPFGVRRTGNDSWRLQAVPMAPVILVWRIQQGNEATQIRSMNCTVIIMVWHQNAFTIVLNQKPSIQINNKHIFIYWPWESIRICESWRICSCLRVIILFHLCYLQGFR